MLTILANRIRFASPSVRLARVMDLKMINAAPCLDLALSWPMISSDAATIHDQIPEAHANHFAEALSASC